MCCCTTKEMLRFEGSSNRQHEKTFTRDWSRMLCWTIIWNTEVWITTAMQCSKWNASKSAGRRENNQSRWVRKIGLYLIFVSLKDWSAENSPKAGGRFCHRWDGETVIYCKIVTFNLINISTFTIFESLCNSTAFKYDIPQRKLTQHLHCKKSKLYWNGGNYTK